MFLDPEPRRQNMSARSTSPTSTISSRASQRSVRPTSKPSGISKRRPLQERTRSEINQQTPGRAAGKPTVRLVQNSPSPTRSTPWTQRSRRSEDSTRIYEAQEMTLYRGVAREQAARSIARRLSFSQTPLGDETGSESESSELALAPISNTPLADLVSGSDTLAPRLPRLEFPPSVTLIPNRYSRDAVASIRPDSRRRTTSSGSDSQIFTIPETDSLFASGSIKSDWFSDTSTLRNTLTPTEHEILAKITHDETVRRVSALETLPEASPERITIRTVPHSDDRSSPDQMKPAYFDVTPEMLPSPPQHSDDDVLSAPHVARSRFQAPVSDLLEPLAPPLTIDTRAEPKTQPSIDSLAASVAPAPSSPIIVVYDSDVSRPQSTSHAVRYTPSVESIQSRLQYPSIIRPIPGTALTARSSYASLRGSPSIETLQPLRVSKKRASHRRQSRSIDEASVRSSTLQTIDADPMWTQKHPSGNLSTIASVSDRNSQGPEQLSHWSIGSGVLTGDDNSAILDLVDWRRPRRWSDTAASMASSAIRPGSNGEDSEAGDMTLGIYREESAIPQPLFRPEEPWRSTQYTGPVPPLPPIPGEHHGDEHDDTLTELDPHALRLKKSAKSLRRQRSNSFSDRARPYSQASIVDSDRLSITSSIFPTWAKQYYGGKINLMSPSKASLVRPTTPRTPRRAKHERTQSQWTARSILSARSLRSRLGTAHSSASDSPTSSHFLPSIFRTRFRAENVPSPKRPRSPLRKQILSVTKSSSAGSVAELPAEPVPVLTRHECDEQLPTEDPQSEQLPDAPTYVNHRKRQRPKKKRASVGAAWDETMLPRRMSHSALPVIDDAAHLHSPDPNRLSHLIYSSPHLTPNKRTSESRLSLWPPPSFVESLDTLLRSRAHRQLALFVAGFICPLLWMVGAVLPVPEAPPTMADIERDAAAQGRNDIETIMMKHAANDTEKRSREERLHAKGKWWRMLNRIMSVIGVLIIAAVIAIVVVATK